MGSIQFNLGNMSFHNKMIVRKNKKWKRNRKPEKSQDDLFKFHVCRKSIGEIRKGNFVGFKRTQKILTIAIKLLNY